MGIDVVMWAVSPRFCADTDRALAYELRERFGELVEPNVDPDDPSRWALRTVAAPSDDNPAPPAVLVAIAACSWPLQSARRIAVESRLYAPGYERGDAVSILAVARFLRDRWNARVFYGGECDDEIAELDDENARGLWSHFVQHGHRPYQSRFGALACDSRPRPVCDGCREPMTAHGGGANYAFWWCAGCDRRFRRYSTSDELIACDENWKPFPVIP